MAVPKSLSDYASRQFNQQNGYWYFTKAKTLSRESIPDILRFHRLLKDMVVDHGRPWDAEVQEEFSQAAANRPATNAWARELKVFFGMLGTAWVESDRRVVLTEVGRALIDRNDPSLIIEQQVRKYQISNPAVGDAVQGIRVIPHHALLKLLLSLKSPNISRSEFVAFVSHIADPDDSLAETIARIEAYRQLNEVDRSDFLSSLDQWKWQVIIRIWSYAANFLSFSGYLSYKSGRISIVDSEAAIRILRWYEAGHSEHIEFQTEKDWFSYYGERSSEPTPIEAIRYYRSMGDPERASSVFDRAIDRGHIIAEETAAEFSCRIQGEALLEEWLQGHLGRLEDGLGFLSRQYETPDAGRLDILARDSQGKYVVIELKRDLASDTALGQLFRYIGWVRMHLAEGDLVRGYIVGDRIDDHMVYAVLADDAIDKVCRLKRYSDLKVRLDVHRADDNCSAEVVDLANF